MPTKIIYDGEDVVLPDGSRHRVSDLKRTNPELLVELEPEKAVSHRIKPDPADVDILGITPRKKK